MNTESNRTGRRARTLAWAGGLVAAGAVAGGVAAATLPASADPTPAPSATAGTTTTRPAGPHGGGQRPGETLLTGTNASKAKAAALKALPGATVDRVETDADGAVYEAHVTKADGTRATVKLDKDFAVTGIEQGMGAGPGPGAPGGTTDNSSA